MIAIEKAGGLAAEDARDEKTREEWGWKRGREEWRRRLRGRAAARRRERSRIDREKRGEGRRKRANERARKGKSETGCRG